MRKQAEAKSAKSSAPAAYVECPTLDSLLGATHLQDQFREQAMKASTNMDLVEAKEDLEGDHKTVSIICGMVLVARSY